MCLLTCLLGFLFGCLALVDCLEGISEGLHPAVCIIVDKWDKLPRTVLQDELQKVLEDFSPAKITELLDAINVRFYSILFVL
jgi:hypothetical protein